MLCVALAAGIGPANAAKQYYVAPTGDDLAGEGSEVAPWQTLAKVRDEVALHIALLPEGRMTEDIVVYLRGGGYPLWETLVLDADDGGNNGYRVLWRNYPGEEPILSGGTLVDGFNDLDGDGIHSVDVGTLEFRSLYVGNQRMVRAQQPNVDYEETYQSLPAAWGRNTAKRFTSRFYKDFARLNREHVQGPGMLDYRDWGIDTNGVVEFVGAMGFREVRGRIIHYDDQKKWSTWDVNMMFGKDQEHRMGYDKYPFYFENSLVFVDRPGEWFLDKGGVSHILHYMPRLDDLDEGSNIVAEVLVPRGNSVLVAVTNTQNIAFYGLSFEHSAFDEVHVQRMTGLSYDTTGQEIVNGSNKPATDGAVELKHVRNIHFERNRFQHTGANAIVMHEGVKQFGAVGNIFTDIGDTAVVMHGGLFYRAGTFTNYYSGDPLDPPYVYTRSDALEDIVIRNNLIRGCGKQIRWGGGVFSGYPARAYIEQNQFSDMLNGYVVNVGWGAYSWSPGEPEPVGSREITHRGDYFMRHNTVRNNEFYDVMSLADDAGVIHTKSASSDYVLNVLMTGNWFHDIDTTAFRSYERGLGKWMFYLDNSTANCIVSNNVSTDIAGTAWGGRGGGITAGEWQFLQEADNRYATNNLFVHNYDETLSRNYIGDKSAAEGEGIYEMYDPEDADISARIADVKANAGLQAAYQNLTNTLTAGSVGGGGNPAGEVSGLVAKWSMENHGLDETPHARHLILVGNTFYKTNAIVGDASLWFGGTTNDYAFCSGYKGIAGGSARTVSAWIQTTNTRSLICRWGRDEAGGKWAVSLSGGRLQVGVHGGNIKGSTILSDGQWHHVAVTLDDDGSPTIDEAKLYVDGIQETISNVKIKPVNTIPLESVVLGASGSNAHQGYLDDVRIYNRALLAAEVHALANFDSDSDSIPDWWEISYFGRQINGTIDIDSDGFDNRSEFISGHDPTSRQSFFSIQSAISMGSRKGFLIHWEPVKGRVYTIRRSSSLLSPGRKIGTAFYPQNSYTDTVHSSKSGFYRVDVRMDSRGT